MSKSRIFYTNQYKVIEKAIVKLLNSQPDFLSAHTAASTRAAGDAIQTILATCAQSILPSLLAGRWRIWRSLIRMDSITLLT